MVSTHKAPSVINDANVLLEVLLERKHADSAEKVLLQNAGDGQAVSSLTAHLVVHFGSKFHSLPVLREFLSDYVVLSLEDIDFEWAFANARSEDFEDALQLAVAVRHGCERFVTFDKKLYETYRELTSIKIELLA